jgi:indole-3-acetate monooxygenase
MTAQDASATLPDAVYTLEPLIRQYADEAESTRRLSPPVVRALTEAGLFRMCVPRALGG